MAYKRRRTTVRRKRRISRRSYSRSAKRRRTTKRYSRASWRPFGANRVCKLRYCDVISLNPGIGAITNYVYSCNGMYDPDISSTGHQPYGFDTLATLYNTCTVLGAKITVTAIPGGAIGTFGIGIKVSDVSTITSADPIAIQEQPGYKYRIFGNGSAAYTPSVSKGWSLKKMVGNNLHQDKYSMTTMTQNPADQWFFHVCLFSTYPTLDLSQISLNIKIEYIAKFDSPKELPQS